MALDAARTQLSSELDSLSERLRDFAAAKSSLDSAAHFSFLDECLLEGLLSRTWQAWCNFCRVCVVESCIGTVDVTGTSITALPDARSEAHVSKAAIRAKRKGNPPYWGGTNTLLRAEPTWGDLNVLSNILSRLRPTNCAKLLAAFSQGHTSAKALQLIRNGAAHNNHQTFGEIQTLRSLYIVFPITHPTHALFWIEPRSNDFLATRAIEELTDVALTAIS
jgi:hypothetical protein